MADGGDLVRARRVAPLGQQRGEDRARRRPGRAVLRVPGVAEAVELAQELAAPGVVAARLVHQRDEHPQVARQRPRLAVEARELAALKAEGRRGRRRLVGLRIELGPPEEPVAGDLDARAQLLPRHRPRSEHRVGPHVGAAADQPLHRLAVEPQRRLGVGDEQQVDLLALPVGRHDALHRQPPRRPQRPQLHSGRRVAVVQPGGLGDRNAVHRPRDPHAVGRPRVGVHERLDAARDLAHALARVVGVCEQARHAAMSSRRDRLRPHRKTTDLGKDDQMQIRTRMSMSADGYVTTPSGWPALTADPSFVSGESHGIREFLEGCEAALMGRTTFEPALNNDRWPWPTLNVFVLASQRPPGTPDHVVTDSDPARLLEKIRAANQGRDVHLVGGPRTIETFRALGALGKLELVVLPLLLGGGMQLTPSLSLDTGMTFERERALPGGSVEIVYDVSGRGADVPGREAGWSPPSQREA
jgi:dihydrofolate reductase